MRLFGRRKEEAPFDGIRGAVLRSAPSEISIDPLISAFWAQLQIPGFSESLIEAVWASDRCVQLNSQQIASMPLIFNPASPTTRIPQWLSNPDPNWYPNGIGDVVFAITRAIYKYGDAFLIVTDRYNDGFPAGFTIVDESVTSVTVELVNGRRSYRFGNTPIFAGDVVQISRNPSGQLRGYSAFSAYLPYMLSLQAGASASQAIFENPIPNSVLKSARKLDPAQAKLLQDQWTERAGLRRGAPAVLPPEISFETLSFKPSDLLLTDGQMFAARVIATGCGVPPFLLNLPLEGGLTYQNPEKLGEFWWRFELRPMGDRIANALSAQMLPRGSSVSFDASATFADLPGVGDETLGGTGVADASPSQQPAPLQAIPGGA
jgi:HK97 family phage portal protein